MDSYDNETLQMTEAPPTDSSPLPAVVSLCEQFKHVFSHSKHLDLQSRRVRCFSAPTWSYRMPSSARFIFFDAPHGRFPSASNSTAIPIGWSSALPSMCTCRLRCCSLIFSWIEATLITALHFTSHLLESIHISIISGACSVRFLRLTKTKNLTSVEEGDPTTVL